MRARVARADADARAAELLADFELEMDRKYPADNPAWADITRQANKLIDEADAEIALRCEQLGIRPEFRPRLDLYWYNRGENAYRDRRAELRRIAAKRVEALTKEAKAQIQRDELEARSQIASTAMSSEGAHRWLDRISQPAALMPKLNLAELEAGAR